MAVEGMRDTLRSLCMSYGWSYAVFWRFDPRNHMMLTMEDAYFEDHAGSIVDSMLIQVHMIGQGIIGEAALNGKHRWMFADDSNVKCVDPTMMQVLSLDNSDFSLQFSSGIKTVAVVPVEFRGVVQLGSTNKISETREFVDQVRKSFQGSTSSLNSDFTGQYGPIASVSSSYNSFRGDVSTSYANTMEKMESTLFELLGVPSETFDDQSREHGGNSMLLVDPSFGSLVDNTGDMLEEQFSVGFPPLFDTFQVDDLAQWLADSSEPSALALDAMLSGNTSKTLGVNSTSSGLGGTDIFSSIQEKELARSSQCSVSNALHSCEELSGVGKYNMSLSEFKTELLCGKMAESLENVINVNGGALNSLPFDSQMNLLEGISEVKGNAAAAPRKGLFSELGLEGLLKDVKGSSSCSTRSCIDEQWPASKKRRVEAFQTISNQIQHPEISCRANLMQPCISSQLQDLGYLKESMTKPQGGFWTDGVDAKSCISTINAQGGKLNEPAKPSKKRAKPGESTKPRPKDRQMIADRIKELRDMIPNGSKLSIDALLSRTFKHMVYMQNLTEQADRLKVTHEPKLIGQDNGLVQKGGSRNATWAYEVGGVNLFCPIVVEDLGHPGQMLIELLCEEQGSFLEIADIVRGFGLIILKGVMEEKNDKIWAQFTVEARNRSVTRMDVFVSLMHLLQGSTSSKQRPAAAEPAKVNDNVAPLWMNYQQHVTPLSI